ncbi:MAG: hypothetical protein QM346_00815 [Chloroflexota bacterium]|nr:hypothetical protein [Chloroflexota bacterium]
MTTFSHTDARILAVIQDRRVRHREVLHPNAIGARVDVIDIDPPAIAAAHSRAYDLLLLDANHELSAAVQWCQNLKKRFSAPLLVLTSWDNEQEIIELYAAGADECIVRPVASDILWAKMRAWLRWSPPFADRHLVAAKSASPETALKDVTVQVLDVEPTK